MFFEDNIDDAKYCGHLYGLGASYVLNGSNNNNNAENLVSPAPFASAIHNPGAITGVSTTATTTNGETPTTSANTTTSS